MSSPPTESCADAVAARAEAASEAKVEKAISNQTKWIITTLIATSIGLMSIVVTLVIALAD